MPRRLRRARLNGGNALWWLHDDDCLVLRYGPNETEVPIPHLIDEGLMDGHYARLAEKPWVTAGAIEELRRIAASAVRA